MANLVNFQISWKICIFVSVNTTSFSSHVRVSMLWIAFKFVSLYQLIQLNQKAVDKANVVNCFQICIFVSVNTTILISYNNKSMLWIAFKFVSLYQLIQLVALEPHPPIVVNCFQICIFVSVNTTWPTYWSGFFRLWIAFKFVSLYQLIQLHRMQQSLNNGCELLSNLYLCIS